MIRLVAILSAALMLAACGIKGSLVRPSQAEAEANQPKGQPNNGLF